MGRSGAVFGSKVKNGLFEKVKFELSLEKEPVVKVWGRVFLTGRTA